jgi:hypothetical protein
VVDYAAERLMASQVSDVWRQTFKTFLATLTFRFEMLTAICSPVCQTGIPVAGWQPALR